jgi:spore coat polysaccharide biosynthesis predicted glycosyltransferase SpsG
VSAAVVHRAQAVIADSYKIEAPYLAGLELGGLRAGVIDDLARLDTYPCSLIVNPNFSGEDSLYAGKTQARLLTGTPYVMLRREFSALSRKPRLLALKARRLLVTFGGVDPKGASLIALEALSRLPEIDATVVVGAANEKADEIAAKAAHCANVSLVRDARNMAARMLDCEMILSGGGATVYESASLGAPMMLVASAPEESAAAKRLADAGLCEFLGPVETLTPETLAAAIQSFAEDLAARSRSSTLGRELVDGRGAQRVVKAIRETIKS